MIWTDTLDNSVSSKYFTKRSDIYIYPTRHVNDLNLTKHKKYFPDNGFRWNQLYENQIMCLHVSNNAILIIKDLFQHTLFILVSTYFRDMKNTLIVDTSF